MTVLLALLTTTTASHAQFSIVTNANNTITITGYTGTGGNVVIPGSANGLPVTTIGYAAFYDMTSITNVVIPRGVTSIGDDAFTWCSGLTSVTMPDSVTNIGYSAFSSCTNLPSIHIPTNLANIKGSAFYGCTSLTNVIIPGSVTNIDFEAFDESGLNSVTIPGNVKTVGVNAFFGCSSLTSVIITDGVILLDYDAFYGCSGLASVTLPASCTKIQTGAFTECYSLTNLAVDSGNPVFSSAGGVLFDKSQSTLLLWPPGLAGSYGVPNGVTGIGDSAFLLCQNLTNIVFPVTLTNIGPDAFEQCTGLVQINLPAGLVSIGDGAFGWCGLLNITLPDPVVLIGAGAFTGTSLTSVTIPGSVTNIGAGAFGYCFHLNAIIVATNNPAYCSVAGVLFDISQTTLVEFPIAKSGTIFKPGNYTIPNGVTRIGDAAFESCSFSNVFIPGSVTSIGSRAFEACGRLTSLVLPDGVTNIADYAFDDSGLTNLVIPASVTTLGWLDYLPSLRSLYFLGNAPGLTGGMEPAFYILPNKATAYYLPGTTGWGTYFQSDQIITALWLPQMQKDAALGVRTNQFGFNLNWASDHTIVVEACTNLANPVWTPVSTNTLTGGTSYFNDPQWTNYPARYYHLRSP